MSSVEAGSPPTAPSLRWIRWFVVSLAMAVAVHYLEFKGFFAGAEGLVANSYLTIANATSNESNIRTVAIDDSDFRDYFGMKSPLDPARVVQLVEGVHMAMPKIVGVDILTESSDYHEQHGSPDLRVRLATLGRGMRTVWAAPAEVKERPALAFRAWLLRGEHDESLLAAGTVLGRQAEEIDSRLWGVPVFPLDRDRVVRRLPRRWHDQADRKHKTFAGAVADRYCAHSSSCDSKKRGKSEGDIFISYNSTVSRTPDYFVRNLFDCEWEQAGDGSRRCRAWTWKANSEAMKDLNEKIVLIGGTFGASRDFFDTAEGERTSGLIVNAHAVQAELRGPFISELSPPVTLWLDILVGFSIAYLFGPSSHRHIGRILRPVPRLGQWFRTQADRTGWRVAGSIILAVVVGLLSYPLLGLLDILWFSWIGMVLVGVSWHLVSETRHMRLEH